MTRELPQFLRDLLASPPRAGEGVHAWLFRVARQHFERLLAETEREMEELARQHAAQ